MSIDYTNSKVLTMREFKQWVAGMTDYCCIDSGLMFSSGFKNNDSKPIVDNIIFETIEEAVDYQLQNDELYIPLKDCTDTDIVCKNWDKDGEMLKCTIIKSN